MAYRNLSPCKVAQPPYLPAEGSNLGEKGGADFWAIRRVRTYESVFGKSGRVRFYLTEEELEGGNMRSTALVRSVKTVRRKKGTAGVGGT